MTFLSEQSLFARRFQIFRQREDWLTRQLEKPGWRIQFLKGFFQNLLPLLMSSESLSLSPLCFFLSLSLSLTLFLSVALSLSLFLQLHISEMSVVLSDLSSLLSTRRRTNVQSTPALCSICLVAKCLALWIDLDLSKPVDETNLFVAKFKPTPFALGSRLLCPRASKTVLPPVGADLKLNLVLKFVWASNCCNYVSQTILRAHKIFFELSNERGKELRTSVRAGPLLRAHFPRKQREETKFFCVLKLWCIEGKLKFETLFSA